MEWNRMTYQNKGKTDTGGKVVSIPSQSYSSTNHVKLVRNHITQVPKLETRIKKEQQKEKKKKNKQKKTHTKIRSNGLFILCILTTTHGLIWCHWGQRAQF